MGQSEAWREAAHTAANRGFEDRHPAKQPVSRERSVLAADAAVRVVLEHLRDLAAEDGNLDDGLWYERFQALLKEAKS